MTLQNFSYKTLFTIFFFALAGIILLTKFTKPHSAEAWWNSSWSYRNSLYINNTGSAKTNILVKILENYNFSTLISQGKVQSDLDDLRFTDSNDTLLTYWVQDTTATSADVWAIIPSLPNGTTFLWMYYGNSSVGSGSTSMYSYSGSSTFIDLGNGGFKIKFLSNGTFTPITAMTIDAFLVGGGAGGGTNGGGGGGGYTTTTRNISLSASGYSVVIGSGGSAGNNGGTSQAFSSSASGGIGKNGGSGGGMGGYTDNGAAGGSNGGNGGCTEQGCGGTGQGTTTQEFGDSNGDLYAGGGGGGGGFCPDCDPDQQGKTGGAGGVVGGGRGYGPGASNPAVAGTANTGGGGGSGERGGLAGSQSGGSGIVILRYNPYTLGYETGNFNFEGLNMEGININ